MAYWISKHPLSGLETIFSKTAETNLTSNKAILGIKRPFQVFENYRENILPKHNLNFGVMVFQPSEEIMKIFAKSSASTSAKYH